MNIDKILVYFALKYDGNFKNVYRALKNKEVVDDTKFTNTLKTLKHRYLTAINNEYPNFFKEMNCPPIVLFYDGNKDLLHSDIPIREIILEDGTRAYSTIEPTEQKGKIVFDYVIACENHDQVDFLLKHINLKGMLLKKHYNEI